MNPAFGFVKQLAPQPLPVNDGPNNPSLKTAQERLGMLSDQLFPHVDSKWRFTDLSRDQAQTADWLFPTTSVTSQKDERQKNSTEESGEGPRIQNPGTGYLNSGYSRLGFSIGGKSNSWYLEDIFGRVSTIQSCNLLGL